MLGRSKIASLGESAIMMMSANSALRRKFRQIISASVRPMEKSTMMQSGWKLSASIPASKLLGDTASLKDRSLGISRLKFSMSAWSRATIKTLAKASSSKSSKGIPCSLRNRIRYSCGIRRFRDPGIRYPLSRPESNHLTTALRFILHLFATSLVLKTFITHSFRKMRG